MLDLHDYIPWFKEMLLPLDDDLVYILGGKDKEPEEESSGSKYNEDHSDEDSAVSAS